MKLNKKAQYGLLLALYLSRSGRSIISEIAIGLNLSKTFLQQVAGLLQTAGVIKSTRGPNGGYEIGGDVTVKDVLDVLSPVTVLDQASFTMLSLGDTEHRALAQYALDMNSAVNPILRRKIRNIGLQVVANELAVMDKINPLSKMVN